MQCDIDNERDDLVEFWTRHSATEKCIEEFNKMYNKQFSNTEIITP